MPKRNKLSLKKKRLRRLTGSDIAAVRGGTWNPEASPDTVPQEYSFVANDGGQPDLSEENCYGSIRLTTVPRR